MRSRGMRRDGARSSRRCPAFFQKAKRSAVKAGVGAEIASANSGISGFARLCAFEFGRQESTKPGRCKRWRACAVPGASRGAVMAALRGARVRRYCGGDYSRKAPGCIASTVRAISVACGSSVGQLATVRTRMAMRRAERFYW